MTPPRVPAAAAILTLNPHARGARQGVMAAEKPKGLTANQKRFVLEYAYDGIKVQAYLRAFGEYTSKGRRRSYQGASKAAARLLQNDLIKAEIEACTRANARRCGISARKVLRELAAVAFADAADVCETDASGATVVKPLSRIPPAARKAIQSVKVRRRRIAGGGDEVYEVEEVEYKLSDKQAALEKLARRLGLLGADAAGDAAPPPLVVDAGEPPPGEGV